MSERPCVIALQWSGLRAPSFWVRAFGRFVRARGELVVPGLYVYGARVEVQSSGEGTGMLGSDG